MEPSPEMVASMHEPVAGTVRTMLAWLQGNNDDERVGIELDLERVRYPDQLIPLRNALATHLPKDLGEEVYMSVTSKGSLHSGITRSLTPGQQAVTG
jgi:hypothetical protein